MVSRSAMKKSTSNSNDRGRTSIRAGSAAGSTTLLLLSLAGISTSYAQSEGFFTGLKGHSEVPPISSPGIGSFQATLSGDNIGLKYELTYINLRGTVSQAHIHFAQPGVNGAVVVFLCSNLTPPEGVPAPPACPGSGTVSGSLGATNVTSLAADQGISAGQFDALLAAMRAGRAYVNVHTDLFPAGELRGQVEAGP